MQKYKIDDTHAESLLPDGNWKLVWNDEFDGTELDRSKWDFRLHLMHTRHNTYTTEGVTLDGNSCVHIGLVEKDGHYYSAQLQTGYNFMDIPPSDRYGKFTWPIATMKPNLYTHGFGYYECRCRLQRQPGWWSAFWLQSPKIGCSLDPETDGTEIDIMESFEPGTVIKHCVHYNGYGKNHGQVDSHPGQNPKTKLSDDFHYFGVDWSENGYTFYIDGVQDGETVTGPVSRAQHFILISTECQGYRQGDQPSEVLKKAILPDDFVVDFVRVFDRI
ncbi:MAG: glycoside hydrolase family 16 protein [Clostridiales bacterium]|nr:glycoside hydrolase family 16 protein [Clostridiales bacterium]